MEHDLRVEATTKVYANLHEVYDGLISRHTASSLVEWCRARLSEGLPEWLVGSALANAHMNLVVNRARIPHDVLRRRSVFLLMEPNVRPYLEEESAWRADPVALDLLLDSAALVTLTRHGASPRRANFNPGAFVRVVKALGLFEFDIPHVPFTPTAPPPTPADPPPAQPVAPGLTEA